MPDSNPLKRLLNALSYRLETLAAAAAVPLKPIATAERGRDLGRGGVSFIFARP